MRCLKKYRLSVGRLEEWGYVEGQKGGQGEQSTKEIRLVRQTGARSCRALYVVLGNLDLVLWAVTSWVCWQVAESGW